MPRRPWALTEPSRKDAWALPPRRFNAVHWPGKAPGGKGGQFAPRPGGPAGHKSYIEAPPEDNIPDAPDDLVLDGLSEPELGKGGNGVSTSTVSDGKDTFAVGVVGADLAKTAQDKSLPATPEALHPLVAETHPLLTDEQQALAVTEALKHLTKKKKRNPDLTPEAEADFLTDL